MYLKAVEPDCISLSNLILNTDLDYETSVNIITRQRDSVTGLSWTQCLGNTATDICVLKTHNTLEAIFI